METKEQLLDIIEMLTEEECVMLCQEFGIEIKRDYP